MKNVCDKLIEADQSVSSRVAALANYDFLIDRDIVNYLKTLDSDSNKIYYMVLGFTELHIGQIKAIIENDHQACLEYFEKALIHEFKGLAHPENIAYKQATIHYLKNEKVPLAEIIESKLNSGNNQLILINMLKGLNERGFPDYKKDYGIN